MALDPLSVDWKPQQVAVMQRLHDWAVASAELNQRLAAFLDLPGSDANALGHILWSAEEGAPLSPVELARRIGMTSGATTALLNRLEDAGHIRRIREHADRRRVTLHPEPAARARAQEFLALAGPEVAEAVLATPLEQLELVVEFTERLTAAAVRANARLAADRSRAAEDRPTAAPCRHRPDAV
jgi:MarR family transcriptional regulator, organic hydroperoxide resistance regulator